MTTLCLLDPILLRLLFFLWFLICSFVVSSWLFDSYSSLDPLPFAFTFSLSLYFLIQSYGALQYNQKHVLCLYSKAERQIDRQTDRDSKTNRNSVDSFRIPHLIPFQSLTTLYLGENPWKKPSGLRLRVISRLKSLTKLDGVLVTEAEATAAMRMAAGARVSQVSLLAHSRTDLTKPRLLLLLLLFVFSVTSVL